MGLDILLFRTNPEVIKESQKKRGASVEIVDEIIALDNEWKKNGFELEQARKQLKIIEKELGTLRRDKANPPSAEVLEEYGNKKKEQEAVIAEKEKIVSEQKIVIDKKIHSVGNIVHDSVPVETDEKFNKIEVEYGTLVPKPLHHHEIIHMIGGAETERAVKVAGHRGYYLKGWGFKLNQALINYATMFLENRKYTPIQTPFFMRKEMMKKTAQLSDFDEELYHVGEGKKVDDDDKKYLIATSEQPLTALHAKEWLLPKQLPIRYMGFSTNFRKEAGAHGKDTWGIFRVHQFEKVEQFCLTKPEESWDMHTELITNAKDFFESLKIPYRVVNIVSGALNNAAAKKYDLEGYFPGFNEYRELVSCSNCLDYQSRELEVRIQKANKNGPKEYVHMLNSTLCATERALCCILENYQTEKGVIVPEVLRPFVGGVDFIPFIAKKPVWKKEKEDKKKK
ncbi:serine--tRNA ligase [Entamoeba marina]